MKLNNYNVKVIVNLKVTTPDYPEAYDLNYALGEMEYDFKSTLPEFEIVDTEILDWEIS